MKTKTFFSLILASLAIASGFTANAEDYDLSQHTSGEQLVVGTRTVTGTLSVPASIKIVDGGVLTLKNAKINPDGAQSDGTQHAGIECRGNATIILEGDNIVRSFNGRFPCIFIKKGCTLTIEGDGTLEAAAIGFNAAAGIGACMLDPNVGQAPWGGKIIINSGTIRATGGALGGAGIGAGANGGTCEDIEIHGGTVIAQGGRGAAGIGGGASLGKNYSHCSGDITIDGGTVEATGGIFAAGIGGGSDSGCKSITIGTGVQSVSATRGGGGTLLGRATNDEPIGRGDSEDLDTAACWNGVHIDDTLIDITSGDVRTVSAEETINLGELTANTTIKNNALVTGTLANAIKLTIADGATVMLDNANINSAGEVNLNHPWAGLTCEGDATIILRGSNTVKSFSVASPGIFVPRNKTLTISGSGSLVAHCSHETDGCGMASGIGGSYNEHGGNIVIDGGVITAVGGLASAGIGGGSFKKCGDITINGGTVEATGGNGAPGIGGSAASNCGKITINVGITSVTAIAGEGGSLMGMTYPEVDPIGPGAYGKCDGVAVDKDLTDTSVSAQRKRIISFSGVNLATGTGDVIQIADNKKVTGRLPGGKPVVIDAGATVTLRDVVIDGDDAQGISCAGNATIILEGKNIVQGDSFHPALFVPKNKTVTITGDGELYATGSQGAGIGTSYGNQGGKGECGNIRIEGGTIVATGGENGAAGIGSAFGGTCGNITIVGGKVTAIGGSDAAGVGCGAEGKCGDISIGFDNGTELPIDGLFKFESVEARAGDAKYYAAGSPIGLSGYANSTCGNIKVNHRLQDAPDGLTRIIFISRKSVNLDEDDLGEGDTYEPEDGESMTGKTAKKVLLKRNTTVSINGVEVSGAVDAPEFDFKGEDTAKTETTEFAKSDDGNSWTLTTFAELSNAAVGADVDANTQIKVYSAESLEELDTESAKVENANVEIVEKKSAVMTTIKVTPPEPTPGVNRRFFKIKYGN